MRSIAVAMLVLAIPAAAHADLVPRPGTSVRLPVTVHGYADPGRQAVHEDLDDARDAIDRRRRNGEITRREARRLRREVAIVEHLSDRYARDGLTAAELRELEHRANTLEVRAEVPRPRPVGG